MDKDMEVNFCKDYMDAFIAFAEISDPGIVHDFATRFDWRFEEWKKNGVTLTPNWGRETSL